ncbi:MAG: alkaline phosphatase family protein [Polyangiaceae bacterium]
MKRVASSLLLLTACALASSACGGNGTGSSPRSVHANVAAGPPYKLVVAIVVDQLSAWEIAERLPLLPKDGGFSRLAKEGTYYPDVEYQHLATDTAPGHAALFTGLPAGKSGVFSNEVVLPSGVLGSVYRDENTVVVGSPSKDKSSSARRLLAPTVADLFRERYPSAKIVSLSLKDRGAIPGGGKSPNVSLWFEPKTARMVTSTAFAKQLPSWLEGKNEVDREVYARPWTLANEEWVKTHALTKDGAPGEGNMADLGNVFPHPVTKGEFFGQAFRTTPYADEYLLSLARDAINLEKLGEGPSFLSISLSSHDYIGHVFGPDSWEAWDELYRLDAELGKFLAFLDTRFGPDHYAVALSADHGVTSLPELRVSAGNEAPCDPRARCRKRLVGSPTRLYPTELKNSLDALLRAEWGVSEPLVLGVSEPYIVLTQRGRALSFEPERAPSMARALSQWKTAHKNEIALLPVKEGLRLCAAPEGSEKRSADAVALCNTLDANGGDFFLRTAQGAIIETGYVPGMGTNHGTDAEDDRLVPVFVRGPKTWEAGKTIGNVVPISIFSRALRDALGI